MPRHFEGNLAKNAENDQGGSSKRSSGFLGKDEWKALENESIVELNPDELGVDSLNPLDISEHASRAEEAADALAELAESDLSGKSKKRKNASGSAVEKPLTERQKIAMAELEHLSRGDVAREEKAKQKEILAAQQASERKRLLKDAPDLTKDSAMELEDDDLEDYDEDAERRKEEDKQVKLAKQKTLKRIAVREANIERLKKETADWEAEKDAIDVQSAKRLKAIQIANQANAAASSMAFERQSQPGREEARRLGREEGQTERSREDQRINEQLEMSEDGKIRGLKNLPLVDWDAARRAMAARMESIRGGIIRLLEEPSGARRDAQLKALEVESAKWMEMYRDGKMVEESGVGAKDNHLKNPFYKQIDIVVPEGVDRADAETLAVSPDSELNREIEFLRNQDQKLDALIQKAGEVIWGIADRSDTSRQKALAELLEGMNQYDHSENLEDAREIKYLQMLDQPKYLDLRGRKLQHDASLLSGQANELRKSLKSSRDKDMREQLVSRIEELESQSAELSKDFEEWQNHPIRPVAMEMRHEDLQDKIFALQRRQEFRVTNELHVARMEGAQRLRSEASEEKQAAKEALQPAKDRLFGLVREKAEKAQRLEALLLEKFNREQGIDVEVEPLAFDIDLTELNELADGIDVDLTDLNERVNGYDLDVDTSDFGEDGGSKTGKKAA